MLFVSYFLLGFLFYLPTAILAAIICVVVFSILAEVPHDLKVSFVGAPLIGISPDLASSFFSSSSRCELGLIWVRTYLLSRAKLAGP